MKSDLKDMEVAKELKLAIQSNQSELKIAMYNHQVLLQNKLLGDATIDNEELKIRIKQAEEKVFSIAIGQKNIFLKLREEFKDHQKRVKSGIIKNGLEDRRYNLANAISRARKQNIVSRSASVQSFSDDSTEGPSSQSSPEHVNPIEPHDVSQSKFLSYFLLGTHEVYKEMQNKRAERKRRSTANPQFLYGNKGGWDYGAKRQKRSGYLVSTISPPNTRQAVKKKNERSSPPVCSNHMTVNGNGLADVNKPAYPPFPALPNLPSGLTIERVSPSRSSPDSKSCISCKQPGLLTVCEICSNGFHISCHNRPFSQAPRRCPLCISKEVQSIGSLNAPSGMSISYTNGSEVSEKLEEKRRLEERNHNLTAELTQLQDRHSQLTISLKNQKSQQDEILRTQQSTEDKINQLLNFITSMKNPLPGKV